MHWLSNNPNQADEQMFNDQTAGGLNLNPLGKDMQMLNDQPAHDNKNESEDNDLCQLIPNLYRLIKLCADDSDTGLGMLRSQIDITL